MIKHYSKNTDQSTPVFCIPADQLSSWKAECDIVWQQWLEALHFQAKAGETAYIPGENNQIQAVILGRSDAEDFWSVGTLPKELPPGSYHLERDCFHSENVYQLAQIAWGLGAYQFSTYKAQPDLEVFLCCEDEFVHRYVEAVTVLRDCINTPAEDMTPAALAMVVKKIAKSHGAKVTVTSGDALVSQGFTAIHTVGRAGQHPPCLIDLQWGKSQHPELVLVGKGVCFDSGGLDIKPSSGMLHMKKDMGGAAHAIALAKLVMHANWPVRLRLLIPAVENAVSSNSYRPGDVIRTASGLTVEVSNTDAEGRLVLSDALTLACRNKPDCLIDFATLTGAAKVALGEDIPALFSNRRRMASDLMVCSESTKDPIWPMPLYQDYFHHLKSDVADIKNAALSGGGGAITAALFLSKFMDDQVDWCHFDIGAWRYRHRSGRPVGGDAMGLRAMYSYLKRRYSGIDEELHLIHDVDDDKADE